MAEDETVLSSRMKPDTRSHASILPIFINELFEESGRAKDELDAIVVSAGPGSYTGLRIGMSIAKGMCYTLDIPLIALDSLENLGNRMIAEQEDVNGIYLATMDSRKGEIYYAAFNGNGEKLSASKPAKIDELDWEKWSNKSIFISGNTHHKLIDVKFDIEIVRIDTPYEIKNYMNLGFKCFRDNTFDNLVYKEPNYLKPFQ